jgi:hypothetical protein
MMMRVRVAGAALFDLYMYLLNLAPAFFGEETPQERLVLTSFKEYLKYFGVRV